MTIGELLVEINGDNSGLKKSLVESGSTLNTAVGKMVSGTALLAAAWKGVDLAIQGINYNKMSEQAEIAFGVFLGSASAAKDMIGELKKTAIETPLEFADVRDAGKQLLAYGLAAKDLVPTIKMLTDVSSGLNIPVKDLAYLYGTIKTQGRAMTVDINQFANRGIPIWEELAKVTGKSGVELRKIVEQGNIGFPQIEKAFSNMTSEGGKFFQMAVKQMDSLAGAQSNLNDSFDAWLGYVTGGLGGPLKDLANFSSDLLKGYIDFDKQLKIIEWHIGNFMGHLSGVSKTVFEVNDDLYAQKTTWDQMNVRGKAYLDNQNKAKAALEAQKAEAIEIAAQNELIKQQAITTSGYYVSIVDAARRWQQEVGYIGKANADVLAQAEEQATYANNLIESYKSAGGYIAQNASDVEQSLAVEATGRQIVAGYQAQALTNQQLATDLEKQFQAELVRTAELSKSISEAMGFTADQLSLLSRSAAKLGNDDLSKVLSTLSDMAKEADNMAKGIGRLAASGGADIGAWIQVAVAGVGLLSDAWAQLWGGQSEAQKKADDEARKAEEERIAAVRKLEGEYQAKFDNDLVRLQKERDERVAYARSIGADVLNIERYYAGEIAKVNRARLAGQTMAEDAAADQTKKIKAKYESDITALVEKARAAGIDLGRAGSYVSDGLSDAQRSLAAELSLGIWKLGQELTSSLEDTMGALNLFKDRFIEAYDGIASGLSDALKSGKSEADFKQSMFEMMRNMAIDAAVIANGFQDRFAKIGQMIAEALKDGFSSEELKSISTAIDKLWSDASKAVNPINELFASKGMTIPGFASGTMSAPGGWSWVGERGPELMNIPRGAQIIPNSASMAMASSVTNTRGDTNITIQSNAPLDPLQTARLIRETQESLAFAGAY